MSTIVQLIPIRDGYRIVTSPPNEPPYTRDVAALALIESDEGEQSIAPVVSTGLRFDWLDARFVKFRISER